MPDALLSIRQLEVEYSTPKGPLQAVDSVNFDLRAGESIGIVGESGSGKSTLAMALLGLLPPNGFIRGGQILFRDRDLAQMNEVQLKPVRWKEIAMVFQNALGSLSPVHRVRDQFLDVYRVHQPDASRDEALDRARELCQVIGLRTSALDRYPHELSGGMTQRVMIALALLHKPDLLILDESTTALDVITQAQFLNEVRRLGEELGLTLIVITHDISVVAEACERILVMYAGRVMEIGSVRGTLEQPRHPYTQAFVRSFPHLHGPRKHIKGISGSLPDLVNPPPGCIFAPRCPYREPVCEEASPLLYPAADTDARAACYIYAEDSAHSLSPRYMGEGEVEEDKYGDR